jgi:hypothetical protein
MAFLACGCKWRPSGACAPLAPRPPGDSPNFPTNINISHSRRQLADHRRGRGHHARTRHAAQHAPPAHAHTADSLSAPTIRGPIPLTIRTPFSVRGISVVPVWGESCRERVWTYMAAWMSASKQAHRGSLTYRLWTTRSRLPSAPLLDWLTVADEVNAGHAAHCDRLLGDVGDVGEE